MGKRDITVQKTVVDHVERYCDKCGKMLNADGSDNIRFYNSCGVPAHYAQKTQIVRITHRKIPITIDQVEHIIEWGRRMKQKFKDEKNENYFYDDTRCDESLDLCDDCWKQLKAWIDTKE